MKIDDKLRDTVILCYKELEDFFEKCAYIKGDYMQFYKKGYQYLQNIKYLKGERNDIVGNKEIILEYISTEEKIKVVQQEYDTMKNIFDDKIYSMKKMLNQNMLELPAYIYDNWNELLNKVNDCVYQQVEKRTDFNEKELDMQKVLINIYNEFIRFCRENIVPCIV